MARYSGAKGVVYMSTSGTGTPGATVSFASWSLDLSTDKIEVTAFGDANKTYVQGLKDIKGTISGFWDDADSVTFAGADSSDGVQMYLYPSGDAPTKYWCGPAFIDAKIDTSNKDAVKTSISFVAKGSWARH